MSRGKLLLIGLVVVVLGGLVIYLGLWRAKQNNRAKTATITVTAAPHDSKVTLNGHSAVVGQNHVAPGDYVVLINHDGFVGISKSVTATDGKDTPVGFALVPNSSATANWYQTHPDDSAIAATITNSQYSSSVANNKAKGPITNLLPYVAGGGESAGSNDFTIAADPDSPDENNPIIYIEADSDTAKQDALTWIKNQGYDPNRLNLKYISTTDPLRP